MKTIINPITGRKIIVGGPTYQKLFEDLSYKKKLVKLAMAGKGESGVESPKKSPARKKSSLKTRKIKRSKTASLRKKLDKKGVRLSKQKKLAGRGSLGKYTKKDGPFCGPKGGAGELTFPVGTKKRAFNALSRSHNAPNPLGIRKCAVKQSIKKGWMTKEHGKELLEKYE